jgi:16S rRNA (cytidine1402-2'-O)-methyltransferase
LVRAIIEIEKSESSVKVEKFPLAAGLWLVGVPIGTARDITLRALDVLSSADVLVAEDTRSLRKLMDIHGIPLEGRRIISFHEHSGTQQIDTLVTHMRNGRSVAYASEAGMPLIADPGFELVQAARAADQYVTSAPGPSAVITAISLSGLASDSFHFVGFLPSKTTARRQALTDLRDIPATLVLYESPKRLAACLSDAAETLGDARSACICRELTKKFEEVVAGSLKTLAAQASQTSFKGEIAILIARSNGDEKPIDLEGDLRRALETMSLKDAAAFVAGATGTPRRTVYNLALQLKD